MLFLVKQNVNLEIEMLCLILFTRKCWLKGILEASNKMEYRILCSKGFLIVVFGIGKIAFNESEMMDSVNSTRKQINQG